MGNLTRVLIVWVVLFALALIALFLFNQFGEQLVQRIQAESVLAQGETLESVGRIDKAIALYEKHKKPMVLAALARAYMKAGRFDDALEEAGAAVDSSTGEDKAQAYLLLSKVYGGMGLRGEAYHALEQAVESASRSAEVHYEMAKMAESRRMYRLMLDELEKTADLKTRDSSELYHKEHERRSAAVRNLKKQTDSGSACYSLGIQYKELGKWKDAVDAFDRASKFDDSNGDAFFWLGIDAETTGDLDRAETRYREAVDRTPAHLNALVNLKRVLLLAEVKERPNDSDAWHRLGLVSFDLANWSEARDAFQNAVKADPRSAAAHSMLGQTLEKQGHVTEARKEYMDAVKIAPIHPQALQGLQRTTAKEQNAA